MNDQPEFSLHDRHFIVWWGPQSDAPAGAPTVMLSPFAYEYDLPYDCTSGFCERLWQEAPMDERITLLFILFANVVSDPDVDCRDALDQFRRVREFQPLIWQGWYWFKRKGKRSGKSMHEMLLAISRRTSERISQADPGLGVTAAPVVGAALCEGEVINE